MKLKVIQGTQAPSTPQEQARAKLRRTRQANLLQCRRCGSREVIVAKTGVMLVDGKPVGGTKQMLCALCLMRGERVVLA